MDITSFCTSVPTVKPPDTQVFFEATLFHLATRTTKRSTLLQWKLKWDLATPTFL